VFNIKSNGHYRSWLVVEGFSQVERIDFDELFFLVICYEIVCLFLAVTVFEDWDIHSCQDRWQWTLFYFLFSSLFYFSFLFHLHFLFLEQLGLGFISHAVTSVTNWWRSHKTDHETWEKGVEDTKIKWCHTAWTTHAGLM